MQSTQHAHSLPTFTHYNSSMQSFEERQSWADKTDVNTSTQIQTYIKVTQKQKYKCTENFSQKSACFKKEVLQQSTMFRNCQQA